METKKQETKMTLPSLPSEVLEIIWEDVHRDMRRKMDRMMLKDCIDESCFRIASKFGSWLSVISLFYFDNPVDVYTCGVFAVEEAYGIPTNRTLWAYKEWREDHLLHSRHYPLLSRIFKELGEPKLCSQEGKVYLNYCSSFKKQ